MHINTAFAKSRNVSSKEWDLLSVVFNQNATYNYLGTESLSGSAVNRKLLRRLELIIRSDIADIRGTLLRIIGMALQVLIMYHEVLRLTNE
jgi:hypothetical protein